jgi:flavorubredoxin
LHEQIVVKKKKKKKKEDFFVYLYISGFGCPSGEHRKYVFVYFSRYGNGKRLVEYLGEKLSKKNSTVQLFRVNEVDPGKVPAADVYVFSAAAEAFSLQRDMKTFLKNLSGMDGKKYGIINTHGMKKHRLDKMEKILSKKNMVKLAGVEFQVQGVGVQSGNGLPSGWEACLDEFAGKLG